MGGTPSDGVIVWDGTNVISKEYFGVRTSILLFLTIILSG